MEVWLGSVGASPHLLSNLQWAMMTSSHPQWRMSQEAPHPSSHSVLLVRTPMEVMQFLMCPHLPRQAVMGWVVGAVLV